MAQRLILRNLVRSHARSTQRGYTYTKRLVRMNDIINSLLEEIQDLKRDNARLRRELEVCKAMLRHDRKLSKDLEHG